MAAATPEARKRKRLNNALAAACSHRMRVRVLAILGERQASPNQIARELNVDVQHVSYHVRTLRESNLIEETASRPVRGAVEHFYRAIELPVVTDEQEAELPADERRSLQETTVALYSADAANAIQVGMLLGRHDHHLTRHAMYVDRQGWEEARAAYMELFNRMNEIKVKASERRAESDEPVMRILSYQSLFELPPPKR